MAHIALDDFFKRDDKEKKGLANLDWLNVDQDYVNLPFDEIPEYIAIPKLEQAWAHENDDSKLKLVPNSDFNFNFNLPKKSNLDENNSDVDNLITFVKKEMMRGKVGEVLVNAIKERSTPEIIRKAYPILKELSKEQGLLGKVYIDPSIFPNCKVGAQYLNKRAKTAKYVKKLSSCTGCTHNDCGRCTLYKRTIASEITYDDKVFNFYSKHLSALMNKEIKISSKEDLQKAFIKKELPKNTTKIAEFKPSIKEKESISLDKKEEEFKKQMEDLKKELSSVPKEKVAKELGDLITRGYSKEVIEDHINKKYSSAEKKEYFSSFSSVLSKLGSLGRVYVEASLMPVDPSNEASTRKYLGEYINKSVKYVLVDEEFKNKKGYSKFKKVCERLDKIIVSSVDEIPKDAWKMAFSVYSENITSKLANVFAKNPQKGLRLAFIQESIENKKLDPVEVEDFDLKEKISTEIYNPPKRQEKVTFTSDNVSLALDKGFTLSSIFKTGKTLGIDDKVIISSIKLALNNKKELYRYQIDLPLNVPNDVKIKATQKDINIDLNKPLRVSDVGKLEHGSLEAPVDNLTSLMNLKEMPLNVQGIDKKSEKLEIEGLNEFTIN